jgi:DedD protein
VAVDIPIEIPDRNKVKPLPPLPPAPAPAATGKVAAPAASTPMITESRQEAGLPPVTAPKAEAARIEAPKAEAHKAEAPKAEAPKAEPPRAEAPKAEPRHPQEAAKAQALLEGKSVDTAGGLRYVVQVGAFAEREKARLAQQKLDRAGLKNYTNVAETKNGPRIRVRAGPFASRAEADKAAQKIKGWLCRPPSSACSGGPRLGGLGRAGPVRAAGLVARAGVRGAVGAELGGGLRAGAVAGARAAGLLPLSQAGDSIRYAAGFVLAFIAALFAGGLIAWLVKKLVAAMGLAPVDRALGAIFGLVRGTVAVLALAMVVHLAASGTARGGRNR